MGIPGKVVARPGVAVPADLQNRENGNRADLMEMMAAMHPKFLRLPGGNYLEGDQIEERFDWKNTIGPLVDRLRIAARGAINPLTGWVCWSFWSGPKI